MIEYRSQAQFFSEGSSALAARPVSLRLIQGGRSAHHDASGHVMPEVPQVPPRRSYALLALAIVSVLALGSLVFAMDVSSSYARTRDFERVATEQVAVSSGDSLWTLAEEHPVPGRSTAEVVDFIREQNSLSSSTVVAGQRLLVPAC